METNSLRTVKIYSTSTGLKLIQSSARTWSQLQSDLDENDISYSNMNAVENVNNSSLVLDDAKLPEGEFVLMLTPQKTKSGNDYKTIRAGVVDAINKHGELAKEHFNSGNKNYTNKTKDELAQLLAEWNAKGSVKTVNVVKTELKKITEDESTTKSFKDALKAVLEFDELADYESLECEILDVLDQLDVNSNLSNSELDWINSVKNKL